MNENKISAVIIARNESYNIKNCLESINWVDEIIIVDAYSEDNTIDICKQYTDKIYKQKWLGYSRQKNFGVEKAQNKWILSIDADERVTDELRNEIIGTLTKESVVDGYYFSRRTFFLGKWIKGSGWYPDYQLRLFTKQKGKFNEKKVHEAVEINGTNGYFASALLHYPYPDLNKYFKKFNEYTSLAAQDLYERGIRANILKLFLNPLLFFIKSYFFKKGFLDGLAGFVICMVSSFNTFVKYAKLWELQKNTSSGAKLDRG